MTPDRAMNWLLGVAFVLMFFMNMHTTHQRDTMRRANVEVDGATITVTCQEPRPCPLSQPNCAS